MSPPRRKSTGAVALAFLVSLAGSVSFVFAYWVDASLHLLAMSGGVALFSLGAGLSLWSKRLMPQGPEEEERENLELLSEEGADAAETFTEGAQAVGRRRLLGGLLATAAGALGLAALSPFRSLGPAPDVTIRTTGWGAGVRLVDEAGDPVDLDRLRVGSVLTVFPEGRSKAADAQVLLLRVEPSAIRSLPGRQEWSPEGYLAYSKVCTHAGCPVGLFQRNAHLLLCPCHQASFDVLDGGKTVFGPAPRALPQLPLNIDADGMLVARSDFLEPVGPARWRMG